jgi:hypothetical protein
MLRSSKTTEPAPDAAWVALAQQFMNLRTPLSRGEKTPTQSSQEGLGNPSQDTVTNSAAAVRGRGGYGGVTIFGEDLRRE